MRRIIVAATVLACPSAMAAGIAPLPKAGSWHETTLVMIRSMDGKPLPLPSGTEKTADKTDCYTPDDVQDVQNFFGGGVAAAGCTDLAVVVKDGDIAVSGSCTFEGIPFSATGTGRYGEASYSETIDLHGRVQGHDVEATGIITGTFLGPCEHADSKR